MGHLQDAVDEIGLTTHPADLRLPAGDRRACTVFCRQVTIAVGRGAGGLDLLAG